MIEIVSAEMINRLISDNIIERYENQDCEIFVKNCRVIQCFNCCQQYKHIEKICRNESKCDHYVDQKFELKLYREDLRETPKMRCMSA